jgi:hypothetical protein
MRTFPTKKIVIAFAIFPESGCLSPNPMCRAQVLPNNGPNHRNPTGIATIAHTRTAK